MLSFLKSLSYMKENLCKDIYQNVKNGYDHKLFSFLFFLKEDTLLVIEKVKPFIPSNTHCLSIERSIQTPLSSLPPLTLSAPGRLASPLILRALPLLPIWAIYLVQLEYPPPSAHFKSLLCFHPPSFRLLQIKVTLPPPCSCRTNWSSLHSVYRPCFPK